MSLERAKTLLPKSWTIPQVFRDRMGEGVGRQRLMEEEGHLLVILHRLPTPDDFGHREGALFWRNAEGQWKSTPERGGKMALREFVDGYRAKLEELDAALEKATDAAEVFAIQEQVSPIWRASRHMHEVLQRLRVVCHDDKQILSIRDVAVECERAAELLVSDTKGALDFFIASNAAKQAEASHAAVMEAQKLNRLAALFFPIATLASIFGMNAPSEVLKSGGGLLVLGLGVVLGMIVRGIVMKSNHAEK